MANKEFRLVPDKITAPVAADAVILIDSEDGDKLKQMSATTFIGLTGADGADGATGNGIVSIVLTSTSSLVKTYTVTYTDSSTSTFDVTDGADGINGTNGTNGTDGTDGKGIVAISLTSTVGKIKTYTITYTDATTFEYIVTDGADGTGSVSSINSGNNITVDNTDSANPIVNLDEAVITKIEGTILTDADIDTVTTGGRYGCIGTPTNGPIAGEFYMEVLNDGSRVMQIATMTDTSVYSRVNTGSWSAWLKGGGDVASVNGQSGTVVLTTGDVAEDTDNNYVTDAEKVVIGNTSGTNTGDQDLSALATKANVLELDNTTAFTPDADYEPATKKYVDDEIASIPSGGASFNGGNGIDASFAGEIAEGKLLRFSPYATGTASEIRVSADTITSGTATFTVKKNGTTVGTVSIASTDTPVNGLYIATSADYTDTFAINDNCTVEYSGALITNLLINIK